MAADRVILGAREVVSVPLSADFTLPETSGSPCVSVPVLKGVGVDKGSRNMGPGPGVLKGVFVMVSSCLRKEGRTKEARVAKEWGLMVALVTPSSVPPLALPVLSVWCLSGPLVLVSRRQMSLSLPPLIP